MSDAAIQPSSRKYLCLIEENMEKTAENTNSSYFIHYSEILNETVLHTWHFSKFQGFGSKQGRLLQRQEVVMACVRVLV